MAPASWGPLPLLPPSVNPVPSSSSLVPTSPQPSHSPLPQSQPPSISISGSRRRQPSKKSLSPPPERQSDSELSTPHDASFVGPTASTSRSTGRNPPRKRSRKSYDTDEVQIKGKRPRKVAAPRPMLRQVRTILCKITTYFIWYL
jgi:hypothetical protein